MEFRFIVRKTLIDLTEWKRIVILLAFALSIPLLFSVSWRSSLQTQNLPLEMQTYYVLGNFISTSLLWILGFFLAFVVSLTAVGFIAKEDSDGTLLLLVSKPISRNQIVLGKFVGLLTYATLLVAVILVFFTLLLWFILPIEMDTFVALLMTIPSLIAFSLLITLAFGALALALSTVLKNQIVMMAIMAIVIVFMFFFGLTTHTLFPDAYQNNQIYYVDMSYHLGNAFVPFMELATGGDLLPASELPYLQLFTGIYGGIGDYFGSYGGDNHLGQILLSYPGELVHYVSPFVSIGIWLAVAAGALLIALRGMDRKNVH